MKLFSFRMAQFADPANKSLPFLPFSFYLITFYGFLLSTFQPVRLFTDAMHGNTNSRVSVARRLECEQDKMDHMKETKTSGNVVSRA